jgi:hypothetical protein
MYVRTPDGERVGRVATVGTCDFTIERGYVFKHWFVAPMEHIIAVDDERDELVVRPLELPFQDREVPDMWFGAPETPEEIEARHEQAELAEALAHDPHLADEPDKNAKRTLP